MKQSMDYYVLPIKGELKNLTDNIYNNSLIEQEAEYTRKVAQQKIFQEIRRINPSHVSPKTTIGG